jgi:hypothetical protein
MNLLEIEIETTATLSYLIETPRGDTLRMNVPVPRATIYREVELPNPNLDAYLLDDDLLFVADDFHGLMHADDLDTGEMEVEVDMRITRMNLYARDEGWLESAEQRAAEDRTDVATVLNEWARSEYAPRNLKRLAEQAGEPIDGTY